MIVVSKMVPTFQRSPELWTTIVVMLSMIPMCWHLVSNYYCADRICLRLISQWFCPVERVRSGNVRILPILESDNIPAIEENRRKREKREGIRLIKITVKTKTDVNGHRIYWRWNYSYLFRCKNVYIVYKKKYIIDFANRKQSLSTRHDFAVNLARMCEL